ncbi:phosphoribosylpyrophosphate synthetase [Paucihalobacter ruber]|uniref:Phosphoribosylpyrophosphate synthetase n=1 Tax=Paucihalobacter ruber TaxID=2567861 RepID=A0A506PNC8_9FLAO|nr:phosphoribosylpyrophosphate synthetase [Paucihalobacter ruber]TPV35383.1 phosphoribosylpyrophosphate synthetase [Paucihalobacter ruber]
MKNYRETLSQVMNQLKEKGYNGNIPTDDLTSLNPSDWNIDDIYRFEGNSNPADNNILYAISKKDGTQKMMLINAYGVDAKSDINNFIEKIK